MGLSDLSAGESVIKTKVVKWIGFITAMKSLNLFYTSTLRHAKNEKKPGLYDV